MAKSMLKTVAMATGVSTLLLVGFSSQTFAMSPFQASYQFNYNGKNMGSATRTLSKSALYTTNFTEPLSYQDSAFLKLPKFP